VDSKKSYLSEGIAMAKTERHKWVFRARFRRNAFGWKSQPAIKRIKEAVSEIKKVARKDKALAAEGAVIFLEKLSPALERIDSSSGAIGAAVNGAIKALIPIIVEAQVEAKRRDAWLERLWDAYQEDAMPYIEQLGDHWGELCASREVASSWADRLLGVCKMAWSPDPSLGGFFAGTTNCLSALLAAERYEEILELLDMAPFKSWDYNQYGVRALAAMGNKAEAIRYAEEKHGLNDSSAAIARTCEEILLSSGLVDEAYRRYGIEANMAGTYLAWFRSIARKYPHKAPAEILNDLVTSTPGEEGKWFAAAKSAGLYDEAIALAKRTPCSPQTLTRAARDFEEKNSAFAVEAGMTAIRWLLDGYGYEISTLDIQGAYSHTMKAAGNAGCVTETRQRIRDLVTSASSGEGLVAKILSRQLELS
jgi:tetratricopeptide (TPR) repeat protein